MCKKYKSKMIYTFLKNEMELFQTILQEIGAKKQFFS